MKEKPIFQRVREVAVPMTENERRLRIVEQLMSLGMPSVRTSPIINPTELRLDGNYGHPDVGKPGVVTKRIDMHQVIDNLPEPEAPLEE